MRMPFQDASPDEQAFYSQVFYNVLLNLNAVQMGLYPTLLCETDDPMAGMHWKMSIPRVIHEFKQRNDE